MKFETPKEIFDKLGPGTYPLADFRGMLYLIVDSTGYIFCEKLPRNLKLVPFDEYPVIGRFKQYIELNFNPIERLKVFLNE